MITTILQIVSLVTGLGIIVLALLHAGSGEGLSDLFGGSTSSASSSAVAGGNLSRMLYACVALWVASIIAIGVLA